MSARKELMTMDRKKLAVRILAPLMIAVSLAAVWIFKEYTSPAGGDAAGGENGEVFLLEADSANLDELKEYGLPIIIDFGSDSCIPCREMAPVLKTMNAEMQGKAIIKFIDVWKNTEAADGFPIQVIPSQIFINADGTPYVPDGDIGIEFNMYSYKESGEHAFTVHQGGLTEEQMRLILADMGVSE